MKKCDECGLHPATIQLTQIAGNETKSFHLCEECAKGRGINISIDEEALRANAGAGMAPVASVPIETDTECPFCAMKLSEFRGAGRLGCADCYKTFEAEIDTFLLQTNGAKEHRGKIYRQPAAKPVKQKTDVTLLRTELDTAIKNEEFERAAKLRDAIHQLMSAGAA